jgi:phosphoribosylformylglycinamidine (FGAM) synthase PurS component
MRIILSAEGNGVETPEIVIDSWRPAVFLGMNSTLKSMVARSLVWERPNLGDLGVQLSIKVDDEEVKEDMCTARAECLYIEDARLILRLGLPTLASIESELRNIEYFAESVRERAVFELLKESAKRLRMIIYEKLFGIISKYCDYRSRISDEIYIRLYSDVLGNVKRRLEDELKKLETSGIKDVSIDNVFPMDVDVDCKEFEKHNIKIRAFDYRLKKHVLLEHVSSAIAAVMTFKLVAYFLSTYIDKQFKILVIEEPEEAMSPPQQVLFAMFLRKALDEVKTLYNHQPVFTVITTHSPYIPLSITDADTYYFYFDTEKKVFTATRTPPARPFIYAEVFQPIITEER